MPASSEKKYLKIRNIFQYIIFILTLAVGIQFFLYVLQISGDGPVTIQRPPGVEGFLPIGALMGWKLFLTSGTWDTVHPAAMVIFGFAVLISLMLRKSFCGWFCPVGTVSEWLWKLGRRLAGRNYKLPGWADYPLRGLKYLLLGFFIWIIFSMNTDAIRDFIQSPYYRVSDIKMLMFFTRMSVLTAAVLALLAVSSLFIQNFWCRYLCPYGALTGVLALAGPTRIERNPENCIGCGRCAAACPQYLPVDQKHLVISPECSGCMDCTLVCPVENTLAMKTAGFGKKTWSTVLLALVIAGAFAGSVYLAEISGYWQTRIPEHEIRELMKDIHSPRLTHPGGWDR